MFQPWTKDFVFQRLAGLRLAAFSSANPSSAYSQKSKPLTSNFALQISEVIDETELHSARQVGCESFKWCLLGMVTSLLAKKEAQRGPAVPENSCS